MIDSFHSRFSVLLDDTMDSSVFHRLAIMDMGRRKLTMLAEKQFHAQ